MSFKLLAKDIVSHQMLVKIDNLYIARNEHTEEILELLRPTVELLEAKVTMVKEDSLSNDMDNSRLLIEQVQ
jgi:hypothetical protein